MLALLFPFQRQTGPRSGRFWSFIQLSSVWPGIYFRFGCFWFTLVFSYRLLAFGAGAICYVFFCFLALFSSDFLLFLLFIILASQLARIQLTSLAFAFGSAYPPSAAQLSSMELTKDSTGQQLSTSC